MADKRIGQVKDFRNIRILIEYDGLNYLGWQRLPGKKNTIQGRIEYVLEEVTGEKIEIIGASRTDKDVHALGQVANFHTHTTLTPSELEDALNELLPRDIQVVAVDEVHSRFHSRYNARMKEYDYRIWNSKKKNIFERYYHYHISEPLDIDSMNLAKEHFIGKKDFKNFTAMKSREKSTVKTIQTIDISKTPAAMGDKIIITYKGDGFLHKMIRIITGTLIEVGSHQKTPHEILDMFNQPSRLTSGFTAPAHGLFLKKVYY